MAGAEATGGGGTEATATAMGDVDSEPAESASGVPDVNMNPLKRSPEPFVEEDQADRQKRQNTECQDFTPRRVDAEQNNLASTISRSKTSMVETDLNRDSRDLLPDLSSVKDRNRCNVGTSGVTVDSSISFIFEYCDKLPKDKYHTTRPSFEFTHHDDGFVCTLTLPSSDVLPPLVGPKARSKQKAKQLVCLDACKQLDLLGVPDDCLCPSVEEPPLEILSKASVLTSNAGVGTTKRKELHGTTRVCALSGTWASKRTVIKLQGYKLNFSCDQVGQKYSDFVLLIDTTIENEAANLDINLYLHDNMVKASVSPFGLLELDVQQMEKAKLFQALIFNGLFGKLFTGSKSSDSPREFILNKDDTLIWNNANMYLLLPMDPTLESHDSFCINWRVIDEAATAVGLMRKVHSDDKMNLLAILISTKMMEI